MCVHARTLTRILVAFHDLLFGSLQLKKDAWNFGILLRIGKQNERKRVIETCKLSISKNRNGIYGDVLTEPGRGCAL